METRALLFFLGMMERIRKKGDPHELDSTTTSFVEKTKLLVRFATFRTTAMEEEQTELIIPFCTIRAAETEEEQTELSVRFRTFCATETSTKHNFLLRRCLEAHEYLLERS